MVCIKKILPKIIKNTNKEMLFNGKKEGNPAPGMVEDLEGIMLKAMSDRKTSNT